MRAKISEYENPLQIGGSARTAPRLKRVDLVVTDCDDPDGETRGADGFLRRCTIPFALLDGDIDDENLREIAQIFRPGGTEPIGLDAFLRLISEIVFFRRRSNTEAPAPDLDHARVERLTRRERQVLEHIVAGHPNKLTAAALDISRRTVEHHRAAIMQKTRAKSVSELVRLALRTGFPDVPENVVA
jgi:DNA-binding CsgD family transcriptional regulator